MFSSKHLLQAWSLLVFSWPLLAKDGQVKTFDQFWPETDVYVKINNSTRLFFLWAGTRTEEGGYTDGQAGAHVDFFVPPFLFRDRTSKHPDIAKNRFLTIRVGYLFGTTPPNRSNSFTEHTPTAEANSRFFLKHAQVTNRNRIDCRFINGEFTPRYRNRLKVETSVPLGRFTLTPYAHAEAFYDWRYHAFHRFRFAAGGELELTRQIVLEGYYLRQIDSRSDPRAENIAGIALQFFLR